MARMYPDVTKTRVIFGSRAEEIFYKKCQQDLPDPWSVYHSCTLSCLEQGQGMKDNEIDFLLYHPSYGLLVVEVKGGRIQYDPRSEVFYSINRHDQSFAIKNPFQQVLLWKSRFIRFLRREGVRVPVSHAVSFPTVMESEIPSSASIDTSLILGLQRMQELERSVKEIIKRAQPPQFLRFDDVGSELTRILKGAHFSTQLHLRDYLDNHELRMKDIEVITETLITPIAGSQRLAIEGEAGTGKTMLAIMLARHFRDLGQKVLLLSSNWLMNSILKREAGNDVAVQTYLDQAAAFGIELTRKPKDFAGSAEDWTQYEGPDRLKTAINASAVRYDVMICDEAQDVLPFWWEAFERMLCSREESHFYLFLDRSQGVFGSGGGDGSFVPEQVLPVESPYFPLVHNYRTTREIATFSRAFRTGKEILKSHCGRLGYKPEIILYESAEDFRRQLKTLVRRLFESEGIRSNEVTLLSARRPFEAGSALAELSAIGSYPLLDLTAIPKKQGMPGSKQIRGKVKVSTIASFKGLETSIAVVLNISEYKLPLTNPIMANLLYVSCTRARHMLYLMLHKDDEKLPQIQKALEQVQEMGSMVLEGSSADYEFVGTVIHYNPDRVGFLKVDDPAFSRNTVMFFPHDVTLADLQIAPGQKLKFRSRVEGHVTIACDLKEV